MPNKSSICKVIMKQFAFVDLIWTLTHDRGFLATKHAENGRGKNLWRKQFVLEAI